MRTRARSASSTRRLFGRGGSSDTLEQLFEKASRIALQLLPPEDSSNSSNAHSSRANLPAALVPIGGPRNVQEAAAYAAVVKQLTPPPSASSPPSALAVGDPLWVPGGHESRLVLGATAVRDGKGNRLCLMFGNRGTPVFSKPCEQVRHDKDEKGVWILHSILQPATARSALGVGVGAGTVEGVIIPAFKGASEVLCLDSGVDGTTAHAHAHAAGMRAGIKPRVDNGHDAAHSAVTLTRCSRDSASQRWTVTNINGKTAIFPSIPAGSNGGNGGGEQRCLTGGGVSEMRNIACTANNGAGVGTNKCPIPLVLSSPGSPSAGRCGDGENQYEWEATHPMFIGGGGLRATLPFEIAMQPF